MPRLSFRDLLVIAAVAWMPIGALVIVGILQWLFS